MLCSPPVQMPFVAKCNSHRHSLEATVNPDWDVLIEACVGAAIYPQRGARLGSIDELGVSRS
jgi:hypothetical protein